MSWDMSYVVTFCFLVASQILIGECGVIGKVAGKSRNIVEDVILSCYENPNSDGSCPYDDITFWLYTRYHQEGIQITNRNFNELTFESNATWKIIFHGFRAERDDTPGMNIRPAYFARGSYNILQVDSRKPFMYGARSSLCYPKVVQDSVPLVAKCSADFFLQMISAGVLPPLNDLHIIGHSLGAHTAGFTAALLNNWGIGTLRRLTGTDPAGPLYTDIAPSGRLNPGNARFVDVHHTNKGGLGIDERVGTVDIWYNGGADQPGCNLDSSCNHQRAVDYYSESISPLASNLQFYGSRSDILDGQVIVGEDISTDLEGEIFVHTNAVPPYARGKF